MAKNEKYKNKYRIDSARMQNWDYRNDGLYFITICTKDREHYFGEIINGKMILSNIGILADVFWHEIKNHAPNIKQGSFEVMPNHIHGIIILDGNNNEETENNERKENENNLTNKIDKLDIEDPIINENTIVNKLLSPKTIGQERFQNQGKNSVSSIIGSYKSAVTKHAHRLGFEFEWQEKFHDHIIRDHQSFLKISNYIDNNVVNWKEDKFYLWK